jgi:hypothetical protein
MTLVLKAVLALVCGNCGEAWGSVHRLAYPGTGRSLEMTPPAKEALDRFGELLIKRVRDKAILDWRKILDGRMKGETAERLRPEISRLGPGELALIERLVPQIVDTALHHLLWTLEQEESIGIAVQTPAGAVPSLREVSDGLAGELDRWIVRFGKEPHEEP